MSKKRTPARASNAASAASAAFGSASSPFGGFGTPGKYSPSAASSLSYVSEPPDLSAISDPSMVVLFKNLSKNNETTKAKALEDLQGTLGIAQEVEEAAIVAWIRLYPRLSTDVSRRVRQLAHSVHGVVCQKSGKRIAKHAPKIIGPWLAGAYDNDRATSRAASDSLKLVFNTEEKIKNVWRAYQPVILEYCSSVVLNESVNSLSDERSVSPDDAENKFTRVIASCVLTVGYLISELPGEELEKQRETYQDVFSSPHLWTFAQSSDSNLRRAIYKIVRIFSQKKGLHEDSGGPVSPLTDIFTSNIKTVADSIITKSLASPQLGSVLDYLDTLLRLTKAFPESWHVIKPSKNRTALSLLNRFIKKGSQGGISEYWSKLSEVISAVYSLLASPKDLEEAKDLVLAIQDGISDGAEPRLNLVAAWGTYFDACFYILKHQSEEAGIKSWVLDEAIGGVFEEFIQENDIRPKLKIPYYAGTIFANALEKASSDEEAGVLGLVLEGPWKKSESLVLECIAGEATDEEKFDSHQTQVKECGGRWVRLCSEVRKKIKNFSNSLVEQALKDSILEVILCSISVLVASEGKATGVASLLDQVILHFGSMTLMDERVQKTIATLFTENLPKLLPSPSLNDFLSTLVSYGVHTEETTAFQEAWRKTVGTLLVSPSLDKEKKEASILQLLKLSSTSLRDKIPFNTEMEPYVITKLRASLEKDEVVGWEIANFALSSSGIMISRETSLKMLVELTNHLSLEEMPKTIKICKQLDSIAHRTPEVLTYFVSSQDGAELLARLLTLTDSPDEDISVVASSINKAIEKGITSTSIHKSEAENVVGSLVKIISKAVCEPGVGEISLEYLADRAQNLVDRAPEDERAALAERLLFSEDQWKDAIQPFLLKGPPVSLAITNAIGSCAFLIEEQSSDASGPLKIWRDEQGFSSFLRMAIFAIKFVRATFNSGQVKDKDVRASEIFEKISNESRATLFYYLSLALELAKDNLGIAGANDLWNNHTTQIEAEILDFVSASQTFAANSVSDYEDFVSSEEKSQDHANYTKIVIDRLVEASGTQSPGGFYAARVLSGFISNLSESKRVRVQADYLKRWLELLNVRKSPDVFRSAAMLTGLAEVLNQSKEGEKLMNELASDLSGVPASQVSGEGLRKLMLLNAILSKPAEEDDILLPPQRAIFLTKNLLSWFKDDNTEIDVSSALITEAAKTFTNLVPIIKGLYGEHWQLLCDFVTNCWIGCDNMEEHHLPMIFATLKLFVVLKSVHSENDDIEDAWSSSASELYGSLVRLLLGSRRMDELHQPRNLTNALIARQTRGINLKYIEEPAEIYSLLNVQSRPVQEAAFEILHRYIPSTQEQISIDAALAKEDTFALQLPAELLSMIIDAPTMKTVEELDFSRTMPLTLRGHLLAWILIFDHFENSSFKVKSAYVENLKEGGYLNNLLDFTFDFLGHSKGRPIDASKFDIENYNLDQEDPEKDTQWLLINLYYLSLRFTPSLSKSWWIDCKMRSKGVVEAFTEKYFSPLIIDKELSSVQSWIEQSTPETEEEMTVRISKVAKEVIAVYPVDDQTMEILVKLPPTFPLKQVEVEGIKRVGLSDVEFKRLGRASSAVINFRSASIIDGLTLFRKNVSLHFQGIAECAICYSILAVTPDRALPTKACSTCKNKFHSTCLWKWFKTSNSSSCPLCRTSFSFYT